MAPGVPVPVRLLVAGIAHEPLRSDLKSCRVFGDMYGHLPKARLIRGKQPGMTADDQAILADHYEHPEPRLIDRRGDLVNRS